MTSAAPTPRLDPRKYDYSHPTHRCDMVMKGGITSGVVYPHAICELAQTYRFSSIGGASAGAIAAGAAAAAELGRESGGFRKLAELPDWLGGNLFGLFQPQRRTRGLFAILTASLGGGWNRWLRVLGTAVQWFPFWTLFGALAGVAAVVVGITSADGFAAVALIAAGVVLALLGALAGLAIGLYRRVTRAVPRNYFGLCTGFRKPENAVPAPLTTWLTGVLDELAGIEGRAQPLTFGDLWAGPGGQGTDEDPAIRLEVMTTNVTNRRPHRLPWDERTFYFDEHQLRDLFPQRVVDWMVANPPPPPDDAAKRRRSELETRLLAPLRPFPPPDKLPVVVAARMSLSFPLLISAVPLWSLDRGRRENVDAAKAWRDWLGKHRDEWDELRDRDPSSWPDTPSAALVPEPCWFSDGGISSNFPVHFFDAPVPRWPTFAIDLMGFHPGYPKQAEERENVWLPEDNLGGLLETWYRFHETSGRARLVGFASAIVRTMQNRVDSAQMRLPGYRDRIAHVKFTPQEGGMNLTMEDDVIDALTERGRWAGVKLVDRFAKAQADPNALSWDNHRWVRLRSTLAAVGELVSRIRTGYAEPPEQAGDRTYEQLLLRAADAPPPSYRWARDDQRKLGKAVADDLVATGERIRSSSQSLDDEAPQPRPEARIVPRD
jgi:predicted acylesterase/phospholipase RssA